MKVWLSSDESAELYVSGEPCISTSSVETGYETFETVILAMNPGTYSIAVSTFTEWSKGGDGTDPILVAAATLDDNLNPDVWLTNSDVPAWQACRRNDEPPGDIPPGPTPGAVIEALVEEAQERHASGWDGVTMSFDRTDDSYGNPWGSERVVERQHRYAMDTYWDIWNALAETDLDVWMTPDLVLHAARVQGETSTAALTVDSVVSMSDNVPGTVGTWAAGYAHDGWQQGSTSGVQRREYGLELGTAISRPIASAIVTESLAEAGRWDATIDLTPAAPVPGQAFNVGDTITLTYPSAPAAVRVLSFSGTAGQGGITYQLEVSDE